MIKNVLHIHLAKCYNYLLKKGIGGIDALLANDNFEIGKVYYNGAIYNFANYRHFERKAITQKAKKAIDLAVADDDRENIIQVGGLKLTQLTDTDRDVKGKIGRAHV